MFGIGGHLEGRSKLYTLIKLYFTYPINTSVSNIDHYTNRVDLHIENECITGANHIIKVGYTLMFMQPQKIDFCCFL